MPHVIAEYSKNLAGSVDIGRLIQELHETMINSGLFEISTIRTRAAPRDIYVVADGRPENVFLQVIARIRPGRSEADRKRVGEALLATCKQALAALPRVAIGVEIHELNPDMLFRHMTV
jgi:5-carboxymethyl-2-hydroxymuconate isomerase